jgi:hypothetical protein
MLLVRSERASVNDKGGRTPVARSTPASAIERALFNANRRIAQKTHRMSINILSGMRRFYLLLDLEDDGN